MALIQKNKNLSVKTRGSQVPHWLTAYRDLYQESPRQAAKQWFREAKFGLFVHLNLASLCERGKSDYLLWHDGKASNRLLDYVGVSRDDYEAASDKDALLFARYALAEFDPDAICTLSKASHMTYITFTTNHLGRCFNFKTKESEFNSTNVACQRDLAGDLAKACQRHGLALFFYVPPEYAQTKDPEQIRHNRTILTELLTQYGPIAGAWFDGIGNFYKNPEFFAQTAETFAMIRRLQPMPSFPLRRVDCVMKISFHPSTSCCPLIGHLTLRSARRDIKSEKTAGKKQNATRWQQHNQTLLREVNTVMQECTNRDGTHVPSGWINDESARHLTAEEVYGWLKYSRYTGSNMLMNIGPRADGSIHPDDAKALTEVGKLIEQKGWPPVVHAVP